jgi:penicillin-binding protein 1A
VLDKLFENLTARQKKIAQAIWASMLFGVLIAGIIFVYISNFKLPDTDQLENPNYEIASQVYANDESELFKIFTTNRVWLSYNDLNPHIINALISSEDERFHDHVGVDAKGIIRAVAFAGERGGGSTITQQLAKQFFTDYAKSKPKRIWQKLKEWVISIEFEKRYTKEEIIAMYLNKFDFYYNAVGIGTASKVYFGKDQKDISPDEAAILIGLLQNPYIYNPKANPENCLNKRNIILGQMYKHNNISEAEYKKFLDKKIDMSKFKSEDFYSGIAPYFKVEMTKWVKELLKQDQYKAPDGTTYDINTSGLKIYSTIDPIMQKHAERVANEHMVALQTKYFNAWKGMDPWTYKTDELTKNLRNSSLEASIRNSDRFKLMRGDYMRDIERKILSEISNSRLLDGDIFRLFDAEKDPKYLDKLIKTNMISEKQADTYNVILRSEYWPELKSTWQKLRKDADAAFNKPVSMKVYDYTTRGEKVVTMTPRDSIKYYQKHMQIGALAVDPRNGEVKAWVGGTNHKYFQFDHVTSNRQVGSAIKPFIYATAIIDQAMSPCFRVTDTRQCIEAGDPNFKLYQRWCPDNSESFSGSSYTLKDALRKSLNSVSVYLMKEIGSVARVRKLLEELGIDPSKVPEGPAICLGTPELSVYDMTMAYSAFANNGTVVKPFFVSRIEDRNGRIIYQAVPEQKLVINPSYNYVMVNMLQHVVNENIQLNMPISAGKVAGKTGTTNDHKDGWFVGFTPSMVVATWVGGDHQWIRFNNIRDGQGAAMARPFFVNFMTAIETDKNIKYVWRKDYFEPEEKLIEIDCSKYTGTIHTSSEGYNVKKPKEDLLDDEEFQ